MKQNLFPFCLSIFAGGFLFGCASAPATPPESVDYGLIGMKNTPWAEVTNTNSVSQAEASEEEMLHFDMALYRNELNSRIYESITEELKAHPFLKESGGVVFSFKLFPNGMISDLKQVAGKENPGFANVVTKAINKTAPFDPWPSGAQRVLREGHWPWVYEARLKPERKLDPIDQPVPRINPIFDPERRRLR